MPTLAYFALVGVVAQTPFATVLKANLAKWDKNHDQKVVSAEVDVLANDASIKGEEAAALAAVKWCLDSKKSKIHIGQLTTSTIPQFVKNANWVYVGGVRKLSKLDGLVFEENEPSLNSIKQGHLGNCFSLATLATLINYDRDMVKRMVTTEDDGSFKVKFPSETVSIPKPTPTEIALGGTTTGGGIYVSVFEKAFGKLYEAREHKKFVDLTDAIAHGANPPAFLSYICPGNHEKMALGPKIKDRQKAIAWLEDTAAKVTAKEVVAVIGTSHTQKLPPGMVAGHAYAIVGKKDGKLLIWNPWGNNFKPKGPDGMKNGFARKNGLFAVTAAEASVLFHGSGRSPAPKNFNP